MSDFGGWVDGCLNDVESVRGRRFALFVQSLIVVSLVCFSVETLPGLPGWAVDVLAWAEVVLVGLFTVEYLARLFVADRRLRFVFSFFGLVDLLAILPFYISTGLDLRAVRAFRLLRLFRIFKLFRYNRAIHRFHNALLIAKEELILFSCAGLIVLYLAAVGIYYCEHEVQPDQFGSVFHSLWWAVATLTTVGYGDVYPVTVGGKVFTFLVLMIGLGVVAVPTGIVASALAEARDTD